MGGSFLSGRSNLGDGRSDHRGSAPGRLRRMTDRMTLAVLGTGAMGAPIARNLVAAGFPVTLWNRTPERAGAIEGAEVASTPADACARADLALSILADDRAVEEVVFGAAGVLRALPAGACHVGMSTISVALSRRLAAAHLAAGHGFVAAPIFGRYGLDGG